MGSGRDTASKSSIRLRLRALEETCLQQSSSRPDLVNRHPQVVFDAQVLEEARRARWRRVATVAEDDPAGERRGQGEKQMGDDDEAEAHLYGRSL